MRTLALLSLLALSATASAVPLSFVHQGRLFDAAGSPLVGANTVELALYDAPASGAALWTETHTDVAFDNGFFSVQLGGVQALDAALFAGAPLFLGMRVNGGVELPQRIELVSVPFAVRAGAADFAEDAGSVHGGVVDASELRVNGALVADASGLQAQPAAHQHDAGDLNTGTVALDRLPIGTSADTVARGLHTHDATQITGVLAIGQVPVGTTAGTVAAGDHTHTAASVGALPVGTTAVDIGGLASTTTAVDIGGLASTTTAADIGGVMQGGTMALGSTTATCGGVAAPLGTMRFAAGVVDVCTTDGWLPLAFSTVGSVAKPGVSCLTIHQALPTAPSGVYWVDPNGLPSSDAFQAYCDMRTDGGGWTLISQSVPVVDSGANLCTASANGALDLDATLVSAPAKLADTTVNTLWSTGRELLVKMDIDSSATDRTAWGVECVVDFKSGYSWSALGTKVSAVTELDSTTMRCVTGAWGDNVITDVYNSTSMCGYQFYSPGTSKYLLYNAQVSYVGGACGAVNAGRSWLSGGNSGCNVSKVFVR